MAKCTNCKSRKGKRKCLATDTFICSLCCGEIRTAETCQGCSYYKEPRLSRNYKSAPHFSLNMMINNMLKFEFDVDMNEEYSIKILKFDEITQYIKNLSELLPDMYPDVFIQCNDKTYRLWSENEKQLIIVFEALIEVISGDLSGLNQEA